MAVLAMTLGWGLSGAEITAQGLGGHTIELAYLEDKDQSLPLEVALADLAQRRPVQSFATERSQHPFWLLAKVIHTDEVTFLIPSRHLQEIACWHAAGAAKPPAPSAFEPLHLARGNGTGVSGSLHLREITWVACRASFAGPARVGAFVADPDAVQKAAQRFERFGGLLFGSLLMLAGFAAVVAAISRDATFFFFSIWIVLSLRMAAISVGWDFGWIGLDPTHEVIARRVTLACYSLSVALLFGSLFSREIAALGLKRVFHAGVAVAGVIPLAALFVPYQQFLPVVWVAGAIASLVLAYVLIRICLRSMSQTALWYGLGWSMSIMAHLGEIARAATDQTMTIPGVSQASGAVLSALLTGVALAQRLNAERRERRMAQRNAQHALQRFRETYNTMPVGLFSMRFDGTIIEYNPTFGLMFNMQPPSQYTEPRTWTQVASEQAYELLVGQAQSGRITDTEISVASRDGGRRWLHMRAARKADRIETWIEDVSARKEAEGRLQFLADHDSLTGLLNRRGFNAHLERALSASRRQSICFAYIDLDRFKLVNDLFGHVAGDQILRQMATRTREVIQAPHITARVGGDEFVVIVHGVMLDAARELCERLRQTLSDRPYQYQDKAFSVSASIGLVQLDPAMTPRDALTASDRACAEAKRLGGSVVVALSAGSSQLSNYLDEIKLLADMRERLPLEKFFTQFQPIVSLRNPGDNLSYEVLVRMRGADGETIPPGRFIVAAERNGLMSQIDRWVLRSTLEWLDLNKDHRERVGFCTVNLSGASLNDERFLQDALNLIRTHPQSASRVCFEVTESVALYDLNMTRRFVDKVKGLGARVALDDFGAGYTSFNYLKELPGDLLKIDGSFIRDITTNSANYAITRAIVELAHEIGMACVAEWAEDASTVRALIDLDVDYAQGYGLCRPVDAEYVLAARDGMALVKDEAVLEMLRNRRSTHSLRTGAPGLILQR